MRESGVPLGASIWATSIMAMASRTAEPPVTERSPYTGWKHAAVSPASAIAAARRRTRAAGSRNHIDDPLRYDDHLLRRLPVQSPLHRLECQDGAFDRGIFGIARHCHVGALPAV